MSVEALRSLLSGDRTRFVLKDGTVVEVAMVPATTWDDIVAAVSAAMGDVDVKENTDG